MEWKKNKYFRQAVENLGIKNIIEKSKSIDDLNKVIDKWQIYLEKATHSLDVQKQNLKICPTNIEVLKSQIQELQKISLEPSIKYHSIKRDMVADRIDLLKDKLFDNQESLINAERHIFALKEMVENTNGMIELLLQVEQQMKIERLKDLNKNKNYQYYHV